LVVTPFFGAWRDFGLREIAQQYDRVPVVNLQFEQLVSPGTARIKRPRDRVARTQVTHCAMGEFFAEFLSREGVPRDHIALTGSLPCQLYRAPYRHYYEGRRAKFAEQHGLDVQRRWIFFPENFGAAFFSKSQIRQRIRLGCDADALSEYCQHSRNSFAEIMAWCAEAARIDGAELILRPRPATAREAFVAAFRDAVGPPPEHRLHFLKDHSVREWILASDAVVSSFSTTLLESAAADKPTYLLAPTPLPPSMHSAWHDAATTISDKCEFLALFSTGELTPPATLSRWANAHLLGHGDVVANVVELVAGIVGGRRLAPRLHVTASEHGRARVFDVLKAASRWARAIIKPVRRSTARYHEADHFTQEDVAESVARWDEVLKGSANYRDAA
jgi:hypothetical protein